jgi:hypothetical protein
MYCGAITSNIIDFNLLIVLSKSFSEYGINPAFSKLILDEYCKLLINTPSYCSKSLYT